jgi:hypothetical protein
MKFELKDVMTTSEVCDKYKINPSTFRNHLENKERVNDLITRGLVKRYKPEHRVKADYIFTDQAIKELTSKED